MSFLGRETSIFSGEPVELYLFSNSPQTWTYTSAANDQTHLAVDYLAIPLERSEIQLTQSLQKSQ